MKTLHHLSARVPNWLIFSISVLLFLLAILSRLSFNGLVYNFDYSVFQPDGAIYTYMTLKFLGENHLDAANSVIAWYEQNADPRDSLAISYFSSETNPAVWSLVSTRIVYPLLSAPFVKVIGIPGMLVVPIASFAFVVFAILRLSIVNRAKWIGLLLIAVITNSPTILRWFISNITDGLLASLLAMVGLLLSKALTRRSYWLLFVLIVIASFTRFSFPFFLGISFLLFFRGQRLASGFTAFTSFLFAIPTFLAKPDTNSIVVGAEGFMGKVLAFPISLFRVLFYEIAQLAVLDRILLFLLVIAVVFSWINRNVISSQAFFVVALSGWLVGALNGTVGVNFRYQLPVAFYACWAIISMASNATDTKSSS